MSRGILKARKRAAANDHFLISRVIRIKEHFSPKLNLQIMDSIRDPRDQARITYDQAVFISMLILKNMTGVVTMQNMNAAFNTEDAINNLCRFSGMRTLQEIPDWQTINNYAERVDPEGFEHLLADIIACLIRTKQFDKYRVIGKFPVILDGTGFASFREKHCDHCLVANHLDEKTGQTITYYSHKVLVAKIILAPGLVLTIGTEFIENEGENVSKQDCENRAAKRLIRKLHKSFPRSSFLIMGDALYAVQPIMELCRKYGWHYLFNIKRESQPTVCEDFNDMIKLNEVTIQDHKLEQEDGKITFANNVQEISGKQQTFNMILYQYRAPRQGGKEKLLKFQWATSLKITAHNAEELCKTGRKRWKIENEGFNFQKNGIFEIEHLCSRNYNAMKVHFLITQIADIFMQLYLAYDKIQAFCKNSIKSVARQLLESFRRDNFLREIEYITQRTAFHLIY